MGWASGLQAGMRLGEAIRQGQIERDLAEESKRYRVTEGAYGPELSSNIEQLRGLQQQFPEQATQYEPAIAELQRRQGLTAPEYSVSSGGYDGGKNYGSIQEAQRAMAPIRTEGLANVYRGYGETEKAEELKSRALQQQAAGLQVSKMQRDEDTENKILKIDEQAGEFLNKRLTQEDGTIRAATPDDMIAQIQHRAALMQKGGLGREAINALKDWQGVAVNAIQLSTAQRNDDLGRAAVAAGTGNLGPVRDFYDKYVLDGAKVTGMTTNKDGSISVSRVRDDGVKLPDTKIASTNALLATLNSFRDPMSLYNFSQNEFKNNLMVRELDIKQQTANTTQEYYKNRGAAEKMGSAQYFQGEDGNTYASIPVMGKEGLKFETVKVNPDDIKMKKAGAGANDNKPVKIEEEGTKMSIGGKTVIADGNGNWIPADGNGRPVGVLPSERTKFLKEAGVPDNLVGQLPWNKTGTALLFNGKAYDPKDPKDLKTMVDTYKRLGKADIAMQEGLASDLALQARARQRAGAQPSLYADPLDWQLYRNQERNLGLIPNLNRFPSSQDYP